MLTRNKRIVVASLSIAAAATLASCSPENIGNDTSNEVDFSRIPNENTNDLVVSEFGTVGDCVNISGPDKNTVKARPVICGTLESNYRIIAIRPTRDQCPADSDQRYRRWDQHSQQTLCLDFDWHADQCLAIGQATWNAKKVACTESRSERPTRVVLDSDSVADCPTGGFAHPVRRFTVCTETQK